MELFLKYLNGLFGVVFLLGIALLFSNNRKKVNWILVLKALGLQLLFAFLINKGDYLGSFFAPLGWFKKGIEGIGYGVVMLLHYSEEGAKFVFGSLASSEAPTGFLFAFQVLPAVVFFAALMSVLYYLGIMQKVVQAMAWVFAKILGTSGAESLSCSGSVFLGQSEAPLLIRPFIPKLTKSELLTIMVGGMAVIAGSVMAAYIQFLGSAYAKATNLPLEVANIRFATYLLGASIMAVPAGLLFSKILYPETEDPVTKGTVKIEIEKHGSNVIEAAAIGVNDGVRIAVAIGGMLIAFLALIAMLNSILWNVGNFTGLNNITQQWFHRPLSFELIIGMVLQFVGVAIGIPWQDALNFGSLYGTKVVLNEFVAYSNFMNLIANKTIINDKTILMATYALCGFANFSSIAIQMGCIGQLAPERRSEVAKFGLRAVLGGSLATLLTATLVGMLF
ncbi:MAG TPA: nucleoside transporter C-terminal domain-containing protein [Ignavibacteriales bacterium]|nr:nucleoside transporter C-terminal domain-containing protein [Ignavibacteriales bacterium]HOL81229.1 nucleoside transporter C-terminal domain-containing protein [Ignavibacteriales bacterium]HOM65721.1 nucleoside transporter C-terminal domain-containing protein [Ignavibacteriales bacterium]HPD67576.1 nucleoside transporter C-terminal domain-containing protein [Ignavibacteriales bacterium]HPP33341.1 nucleoside transporter C-terminal domain-containing protein [Ignavibacteriales bacterium]